MNKFFSSKYPIVEAIMNPVSDLKLALAVADAGAFPSLFTPPTSEELDILLTEFYKSTGNMNLAISFNISSLDSLGFIKVLKKHKPSHIEIFLIDFSGNIDYSKVFNDKKIKYNFQFLNSLSKTMIRIFEPIEVDLPCHGYCVKGLESAGKTGIMSVKELFKIQKEKSKNKVVIPYGGIGTPQHVKEYIDMGAEAVTVGTLLACSKESMLSVDVKKKMIRSTSNQITKSAQNQNQLEFGKSTILESSWNRDKELCETASSDASKGFMYVGTSIDYVNEELSVKEIIEYLVSDLK